MVKHAICATIFQLLFVDIPANFVMKFCRTNITFCFLKIRQPGDFPVDNFNPNPGAQQFDPNTTTTQVTIPKDVSV